MSHTKATDDDGVHRDENICFSYTVSLAILIMFIEHVSLYHTQDYCDDLMHILSKSNLKSNIIMGGRTDLVTVGSRSGYLPTAKQTSKEILKGLC